MKPFLQGPAGFDYLTQAFEKRYGPPSEACDSLPVTRRWILALSSCKDEWEEHTNTLSALNVVERPSMGISLKTGGSFLSTVNTASQSTVTDTAGFAFVALIEEAIFLLLEFSTSMYSYAF